MGKIAGEKNHLNSAGCDAALPNHELMPENEREMEDVSLLCLTVSPL